MTRIDTAAAAKRTPLGILRVADPRERIRDLRSNYGDVVCAAGVVGAVFVASAYVKSANVIVVIVAIVAASVRIGFRTAERP